MVVDVRIVLLNQYYAPDEAATARFLSDVGEDLAGQGHQVSAVCSRRSYSDPSIIYPARETIRQVRVYRAWTTGFGRFSKLGRLIDYASFLIGAGCILALHGRIDVVLSLTTPPMIASLGLALSRLRGASSLFWVMDVYPQLACELGVLGRRSFVTRLLDRLGRCTLNRSDGVIALGQTMADKLHTLSARRVTVIHNWADGRAIRPVPVQGNELRAARGWEDRFGNVIGEDSRQDYGDDDGSAGSPEWLFANEVDHDPAEGFFFDQFLEFGFDDDFAGVNHGCRSFPVVYGERSAFFIRDT